MYEALHLLPGDTGEYLRRIGLEGEEIKADLAGLDRLIHAQLTHVPFDDMDVWGGGICPELGIDALFEKIVLRRRGGYCFELNSLFNALLRALGFESYMVIVHIMSGKTEIGPPSHCAIVCVIDGEKYFCDVGYGGAVPDGGLHFGGEERFGFVMGSIGVYKRVFSERYGVDMLFRDIAIEPVELIPLNYYISQNPGSLFREQLHVNLRLDDGSVSIVDHEFKLRRGGERVEKYIDLPELPAILEEYFGIPRQDIPTREMGPRGE